MHLIDRMLRPHLYRLLAHRVVVQTEAVATRTRSEWGLRSVAVVPNAVLIPAPHGPKPDNRLLRVLSVGRLARQKGHDLLIDAWARLAPQFPNWHLRIVGEGPLRSSLEEQAARLGLSASVSLPGMVQDVAAEYRAASIFVLPSRFEGFPNALLEAMACGCTPIATSDAGASGEVIQPEVNGILVPTENSEALSDALSQLMLDSKLRQRYSSEAATVAARYAPDRIFRLWRQILMEGRDSSSGVRNVASTPETAHLDRR
jgi:glycosyltransferase involved in cell wall biosynthesis